MAHRLPHRIVFLGAGIILMLAAGGCRILTGGPLKPPRPQLSAPEVISAVRDDTQQFRTLVDTDISISIAAQVDDGWKKMPTFGGLIAFDSVRPGLWLRAEKLGQKIFTLRAGGDYFWLELPDSREIVTGGSVAYDRLPHLVQPNEAMLWFAAPEWLGLTWENTTMDLQPETYRFDVRISGQLIRSVYVDRRTLHISRIEVHDLLRRVRTRVSMERYRDVKGVEFPFRMTILRPLVGYRIRLTLDEPTFNKNIPARAFEPKDRPGWEHINLDYEPLSKVDAFSPKK